MRKDLLKARADIFHQIRTFFRERNVLEVDTPLLSHATVTDRYIDSLSTHFQNRILYLQTSPEYAMKRLLAEGSGSIFQITKAFRQGDVGRYHQPEFTMLEWYRLGFNHHQLMDEMDELLSLILKTPTAARLSVAEAYEYYVGINPHYADIPDLIHCIHKNSISFSAEGEHDKNFWLDLLFTHCIEPHLGQDRPYFLYDFPISQASLAKIRFNENPPVASRFEVYFKGIELANGFHELQDAAEQRQRFENDLKYRTAHHLSSVPIDENFLQALKKGLPDCAGVALGVDRLIMLALQKNQLQDSLAFFYPIL